jgi:hypothetical protein
MMVLRLVLSVILGRVSVVILHGTRTLSFAFYDDMSTVPVGNALILAIHDTNTTATATMTDAMVFTIGSCNLDFNSYYFRWSDTGCDPADAYIPRSLGWHDVTFVLNTDTGVSEGWFDGVNYDNYTTPPGTFQYIDFQYHTAGTTGDFYVDDVRVEDAYTVVIPPTYLSYDGAETGTPAENGWYRTLGSGSLDYTATNPQSGSYKLETSGGSGTTRWSANITDDWTNKTLDFWMYDNGVNTFSLFGMGTNDGGGNGWYAQRNLAVSTEYYIYGSPSGNDVSTVPLSVGWHHFQMYVNPAGDRGIMYIDDVLAFNFTDGLLGSLEPLVEIYDVTSEGILLDEVYVYSGSPMLPCVADYACNGYESCVEPALNVSCNSVTDNNACGYNYTGDYSEFTISQCSYTPAASSGSSGGSGGAGYYVDADGNYAGRIGFIPASAEAQSEEGTFLSLGGQGGVFDVKTLGTELWNKIKGWFVNG